MQVGSTEKSGVTIVTPSGVIDTRTAMAFESVMVQAFTAGTRSFAVDFTRVDLITSAGIRVLVMMVHRLRGTGALVLFGLNDRVRTVLEIGGLLQNRSVLELMMKGSLTKFHIFLFNGSCQHSSSN